MVCKYLLRSSKEFTTPCAKIDETQFLGRLLGCSCSILGSCRAAIFFAEMRTSKSNLSSVLRCLNWTLAIKLDTQSKKRSSDVCCSSNGVPMSFSRLIASTNGARDFASIRINVLMYSLSNAAQASSNTRRESQISCRFTCACSVTCAASARDLSLVAKTIRALRKVAALLWHSIGRGCMSPLTHKKPSDAWEMLAIITSAR
mmetsp:Transcript_64352/g.112279  ORF Transcript_64352/g.112279 Transcript_64352/m.112279 type:complete len:202 (+) Transcript_64352:951-1556(+)